MKGLAKSGGGHFRAALDRATETVITSLPVGAQNWGAARKAINLFLRDVVYNRDLSEKHGFKTIRRWLEVPLDSNVTSKLRKEPEGKTLPKWPGLKKLTANVSDEFQSVAAKVAKRKRITRVDLDVYYWRSKYLA